MSRPVRVPSYRLHKARNCAVATLDGKDHYLGDYDSAESHTAYDTLITDWLQQKQSTDQPSRFIPTTITIGELAIKYLAHCEQYYTKDYGILGGRRQTGQISIVKVALRSLVQHFEAFPASQFGPKKLMVIQDQLIASGKARVYVNKLIKTIKLAFRWGGKCELIPASVYHAVSLVESVQCGRTEARETEGVSAVDDATVESTLPHCTPVIASMIRLQQITGARPGELVILRPADVTMRPDGIWVFRPVVHKNQHKGASRHIFIGPAGQDVLRPYMVRDPNDFCFSPRESAGVSKKRPKGKRPPGSRFTTASYRRAIGRACQRAFSMPLEMKKNPKSAAQWRKQYCWAPNQLRHSAATRIEGQFGIEAAQVVLGHASPKTTDRYVEKNLTLAADLMKKIG